MSALSGMHIDNAIFLIDGPEVPIMDGSSFPFVEQLEISGIQKQEVDRKIILVKKEVQVKKMIVMQKLFQINNFQLILKLSLKVI